MRISLKGHRHPSVPDALPTDVAPYAHAVDLEQRLAADVTTERREELREAARQIATGEGVGLEDVVLANDRPVPVVAQEILTWLGWV
jgi:hypothetical protein